MQTDGSFILNSNQSSNADFNFFHALVSRPKNANILQEFEKVEYLDICETMREKTLEESKRDELLVRARLAGCP